MAALVIVAAVALAVAAYGIYRDVVDVTRGSR